ncbi:MAG: hypothetical protein J3Q66DRAFT_370224 [Benniella sp.]|nr:MAG: hypothetical protein J3Q66DRAFT_370224 [Benniella sp.]
MALLPSSAKKTSNVTKDQALAFCFTLSNPRETWAKHSHFENCLYANAIWSGLQPERGFWNALDTPDVLRIREYFGKDVPGTVASECWPGALPWMKENDVVMSALGDLTQYLRSLFEVRCAKFSDLECIMSRIHVGSCKTVVLGAFQSMMSYSDQFESRKLLSILEELPDLTEYLEHFYKAFGHQVALEEGEIVPFAGFTGDFDADNDALKQLDSELAAHLDKARNELNRYHNPELTVLVARPQEPREVKNAIMRDLQGRLYAKFDENYKD